MTASPSTPAPENRPTALAELLDDVTPTAAHYRRNHYPYPAIDPDAWRLPIGGSVRTPVTLTLADLRELPRREHRVLLECAGHRRTEFQPPISGLQWNVGALSQADWSGVALVDVLAHAGMADGAIEVVLHGADAGAFGELSGTHRYSRSLPLAKALHPDTLLALDMNGAPLPREHGAPVRAVVPGWYAMDSVKWIVAIEVVAEPFRGAYQELDYRWQPAGTDGIGTRIDAMPAHALFVTLADGDRFAPGLHEVEGIAWGGEGIAVVDVRVGTGPWEPAKIIAGHGPYERVRWRATIELVPGRYDVAVRATDVRGRVQPPAPTWNRRGYVNNSIQHVVVTVG